MAGAGRAPNRGPAITFSNPSPHHPPHLKSVSDSSGSWFQESVVFFNSFLGTLSTPECQIFGLFDQTLIHICTLQTVFLRSWMKSSSLQDPPLDRTRAGAGAHKTSWSPLQWTCSPAPPPATSPPQGGENWFLARGGAVVLSWWCRGGELVDAGCTAPPRCRCRPEPLRESPPAQ